MDARERDIQELCKQVLSTCCEYTSINNMSGLGEHSCPFCGTQGYHSDSMETLKHDVNCAYLIAKDLSVGVNAP